MLSNITFYTFESSESGIINKLNLYILISYLIELAATIILLYIIESIKALQDQLSNSKSTGINFKILLFLSRNFKKNYFLKL